MSGSGRRVLVTGARGRVGAELVPALVGVGWEVLDTDLHDLDVRDREAVLAAIKVLEPDLVFNLAAETDVEQAEIDEPAATLVNAGAVGHLREAAEQVGSRLVHLSTDYVFGGHQRVPYTERAVPDPLSAYGRSKAAGEVLADGPDSVVVRTAWLSGRHGRCAARTIVEQARDPQRPLVYVADQVGTPTAIPDLVAILLDVAESGAPPLVHVTNAGSGSWFDLAQHVLAVLDEDPDRVRPVATSELVPPPIAKRPEYSVLGDEAGRAGGLRALDDWHDAIDRLVRGYVAESGWRR